MRQKGAVLIIGLIFLIVVTLIGITAMQKTTVDTKINGNYKSYTIAFEGTESALRAGESRLSRATSRPTIGGNTQSTGNPTIWAFASPGNCTGDNQNHPDWWFSCGFSWWQSQVSAGRAYLFANPLFSLESDQPNQPMYLIEQQTALSEPLNWGMYEDMPNYKYYFRITTRGSTGQNSQSDVMLQSVSAWRYR